MKRTNHNYDIQLATEAFKSSGYLILNKELIRKFGLNTACILSNYIDKYNYFSQQAGFNGSFFLRHKDIMDHLFLKENMIITAKKQLVEMNILSIIRKGIPAKEWITINFDSLISQVLVPHKSGALVPHKSGGLINNNKDNNNKVNKELLDNDNISIKKQLTPTQIRTKEFMPIAQKLSDIISSKKQIKIPSTRAKEWANPIRLLCDVDGVDIGRIKKMVRWYKTVIGEPYIPIIESGYTLREKFVKLEDAKKRKEEQKRNQQNRKPRNAYQDGLERKYSTGE